MKKKGLIIATLASLFLFMGMSKDLMGQQNFQINIKTMRGEIIVFDVSGADNVKTLKMKIEDKIGIPYKSQRLIFNGKELGDNENKESIENIKSLDDYNIKDGDFIHLAERFKGG